MGTCTIRIWYPTDILDLFSPLFTVAHCATLLCAQHSSSPPRVDCPIMVSTSGRVLLEVCHSLCHGRRASLPCVHISSRRAISPRLFVAFDRDMNPVLRDCVELYHPPAFVHPLEGHHALGPFVFHGAKIVSMTIEALPSPLPILVVGLLDTGGPNAHPAGSMGVPPLALPSHPMSP
jgi:hypothetical protein